MQSLYSYHQAVGADLLLAQDRIAAAFEPDLTAKEAPDRRQLEGQRKLGEAQLREWYKTGTQPEKTDDKAVDAAVADAISYFEAQVKKDAAFFGGQLLAGAESIHDQYLHLLNLPAALLGVIEEEQSREERRRLGPREDALDANRLHQNAAIAKLMANEQLQDLTIRRKLAWEGTEEVEALRAAWQEMKADGPLREYLAAKPTDAPELDYDADMEILRTIYKDYVFKGEALPRQLESDDLNWEENRPIVRNLVLKTLKMLPYAADEKQELMNLSANWADDREFAETLYKQTLVEDDKMEKLIAGSVQNWDVERVALLDKIILKMALTEMQLFRGIPVKVTINEYIEISKLYSTPKSKQFVNGILDKLAQDLAASGDIRKSGRGLLDNQ
ncbi:transcription antitermination factor NusB [Hymenobacter sp. BT770]|uniref:transcription antitermination factor NusB n=1 Tax=Hymenobacter sp. BT770 TaxID=2886942 RepID=UPI001D11383C|nr:transcription antitermination factor NusB [Hymenobacter sp. BT770]MCC3153351.1 transcription antitermination factor NusB [Hymenobacter sp. BT770]MDO3415567.1 transcription antitermination factor NusB [Hymenobacter sp. BT770]